jgi:hypothetical protein
MRVIEADRQPAHIGPFLSQSRQETISSAMLAPAAGRSDHREPLRAHAEAEGRKRIAQPPAAMWGGLPISVAMGRPPHIILAAGDS